MRDSSSDDNDNFNDNPNGKCNKSTNSIQTKL